MEGKRLNKVVFDRICKHMNNDHKEALLSYAKYYGNLEEAIDAKLITITESEMKLEVDGSTLYISFDHKLTGSEDAHKTLISMLRKIPGDA